MAHIKSGGTTKGNRDSVAKRLGIKKYAGEKVINGNIIVRQRGAKFHAGIGTKMGRDFTIYSIASGTVNYLKRLGRSIVIVNQTPSDI